MPEWNLYADGSLDTVSKWGNEGAPGGWAFLLENAANQEGVLISGSILSRHIVNVEAEAVIRGLRHTTRGDAVHVFCDSTPVLGAMLQGANPAQQQLILDTLEPDHKRRGYRAQWNDQADSPGELFAPYGVGRGRFLPPYIHDRFDELLSTRYVTFTKIFAGKQPESEAERNHQNNHNSCHRWAAKARNKIAAQLAKFK